MANLRLVRRGDAPPERAAVGVMTGTSVDGIDLALVHARGTGLGMAPTVVRYVQEELGELRDPLRRLAAQEPLSALEIAKLARDFGELHASALSDLTTGLPHNALDLVAVHGQTVAHGPDATWALVDPTPVLGVLGCAVVTDLRLVDRAYGGEGAPISPLADWMLLRGKQPRTIVNLGGFANVTLLPGPEGGPEGVRGGDVAPCNQLLDTAARRLLERPFDQDGIVASQGTVDADRAERVGRRLAPLAAADRSLGTGDEALEALDDVADLGVPDALATLCAAIARNVAARCGDAPEVRLFGGGARNAMLVKQLRNALPGRIVSIGAENLPPESREAAAMAVLGLLAADGVPVTLPAVTGREVTRHFDGRWILAR